MCRVPQVRLLCEDGTAGYLPVDRAGGRGEERQLVVRLHRLLGGQLRRIRHRGVHARGDGTERLHSSGAEGTQCCGRQGVRRHHPTFEQEAQRSRDRPVHSGGGRPRYPRSREAIKPQPVVSGQL